MSAVGAAVKRTQFTEFGSLNSNAFPWGTLMPTARVGCFNAEANHTLRIEYPFQIVGRIVDSKHRPGEIERARNKRSRESPQQELQVRVGTTDGS
jgi:hypothetical protein